MAPDGDAQPPLGQDIVLASQEICGSVPSATDRAASREGYPGIGLHKTEEES